MLVLQQKLNRRVHVCNSDVSTRRFAKTCICQSHELRRQRSSRALPHTACCHRLGAPKVAKHLLPSSSDVSTRRFAETCVCVKVMHSGGGAPAERCHTPLAVPKPPNICCRRSWHSRFCRPPALTHHCMHVCQRCTIGCM